MAIELLFHLEVLLDDMSRMSFFGEEEDYLQLLAGVSPFMRSLNWSRGYFEVSVPNYSALDEFKATSTLGESMAQVRV